MTREIEHSPDELETATAGSSKLNAFRSLARSRGVDLRMVLKAAERGELRSIVSMRAHGKTLSPARPSMGAKTGDDCLTVLAFKRQPEYG